MNLKDGFPDYLPELDKMFQGIAVTGESSYAPSRSNVHYVSTDEDEEEDAEQVTPLSIGSKRSSSSRSTCNTGASPTKRSRRPAIRTMNSNMRNLNVILENKNEVMRTIWESKQRSVQEKKEEMRHMIQQVLQLAREVGATEKEAAKWVGVLKITKSESDMAVFIGSAPEGRMAIIDYYAGVGN
jgi:hypothetical protein